MSKIPHVTGLAASALVFSAALASGQDVVIVYKTTGVGGEREATHYYTPRRVRLNEGTDETILDFADGHIVSISHKKKQYSETTFAEMEQAVTHVSAEMEKSKAGVPEDLRNKMMGDVTKAATITKTDTRTIAGLVCQNYVVAVGDKTRTEICVTTAISISFDPKYFDALMLVTAPPAHGNSAITKMVEKLRTIKGFALATSTSMERMGKTVETASEAIEVRKEPVADSIFELPAGYKKVDSPFAKMAH